MDKTKVNRRRFIAGVGAGLAVAGTAVPPAPVIASGKRRWRMVTSWPKHFPGLGTGAEFLARAIGEMSGGEIQVRVYGAGELVPAFEVFDAVSRGVAEMGHSGAYYWKGKHPATQFFSVVPFAMNAQEMHAWLYHGGGLELWRELYDRFGLIANPAGNAGVQMAGWFNKEIHSVPDLKGLKMRIQGFGAEALNEAGGIPVALPGAEIFPALQSGALDATEWVGPYNDLAFGLHRAAKYYYYPGWHEPGSVMECFINKQAFNALPKRLQVVVTSACRVATQDMLAEYTARNNDALKVLVDRHKVELRRLPDGVLRHLRGLSREVVEATAAKDPLSAKIYRSFSDFHRKVAAWHDISERAFLNARAL